MALKVPASPSSALKMAYKIIFASDLHGNKRLYEKLSEAAKRDNSISAIVLGGDLCPREGQTIDEAVSAQKEFIAGFLADWAIELGKPLFLMMGNDDYRKNLPVLEKASVKAGFNLLHGKPHVLGRFNITGYSFVPRLPFLLKDWEKPDDKDDLPKTDAKEDILTVPREKGTIADDMEKIAKLTDPKKTIYVIHTPPYGTSLDVIFTKENVGSRSVRRFIEKNQPPITLHGHIHESVIAGGEFMEKIGDTVCINPGSDYMENLLNYVIIDIDDPVDVEHEMI